METTVLMGALGAPDVARVQIAGIVGEQVAAPHRGVYLTGAGGYARGPPPTSSGATVRHSSSSRSCSISKPRNCGPPSASTRTSLRSARICRTVAASTPIGVPARRVDDLGDRSEPAAGVGDRLGRGEDQRRHLGAGEDLGVVVERAAVGDDGDGRHLGLAAALAGLALRGAELRARVVLDPDGARTDQDDVGDVGA